MPFCAALQRERVNVRCVVLCAEPTLRSADLCALWLQSTTMNRNREWGRRWRHVRGTRVCRRCRMTRCTIATLSGVVREVLLAESYRPLPFILVDFPFPTVDVLSISTDEVSDNRMETNPPSELTWTDDEVRRVVLALPIGIHGEESRSDLESSSCGVGRKAQQSNAVEFICVGSDEERINRHDNCSAAVTMHHVLDDVAPVPSTVSPPRRPTIELGAGRTQQLR